MANGKKKNHRLLKIFLEFQALLILLVIGVITYYYVGGYASHIDRLHDSAVRLANSATIESFKSALTSVAYDSDGEVLSIMKGEKDVYYLDYSEIPIYAKEAIISIEDKKFYDHRGVDYRAIVRAAYAMFKNGKVTQGASTITQQLARGIFLTQDRTWERKIEEIYLALELEKRYSKNQILEFYLNNIYFASGFYGIEAASRGYFNLPSSELSLSQIAFLVAIPNSPTRLDPKSDLKGALDRRDLILRNMYDDGIINLDEYQDALMEEITLNMTKTEKHDYQETYTFYCATRALMAMDGFEFKYEFSDEKEEEDYRKEYNSWYDQYNRKLYSGGYRIYTSLDSKMQSTLQEILDNQLSGNTEKNENGIYELQGSAVCIDNETGLVKAIVGGREQEYDGYTLNRAYQSYRQPGSSIKPLVVYTPVLEHDYEPDTLVSDIQLEGGPSNSSGNYSGNMTLRRAVELSKNTVAWQLLEELTPEVGLSYLKKMHFSGLDERDNVPAISLGGFTNGMSALEMAEGFSTLENDGYFREATCIVEIKDANGNSLYEPERVSESVYNENAARKMTDILRGVFYSPGATGRGLAVEGQDCAGKTGTTNDNKDGWFVGYTPYYTTSVWVGYDTPKTLPGLWGSTIPGRIWQKYMSAIHEDLEYKALEISPITEPVEEITDDTVIPIVPYENGNRTDEIEITEIIEEYTVETFEPYYDPNTGQNQGGQTQGDLYPNNNGQQDQGYQQYQDPNINQNTPVNDGVIMIYP